MTETDSCSSRITQNPRKTSAGASISHTITT